MGKEDFRYDVTAIRPDNVPLLPVGTLEEIQKENMDPAVVPSCHERVMNGSKVVVKGCIYNDATDGPPRCQLTIRGEAGPQFFGIETLKGQSQGGKMLRGVRDCFYIAQHKAQIEHPDNGGVMSIIAHEGEKLKLVTVTPANGYKDKVEEIEVPFFPRPGQNPDLAMEQLKAISRMEAKQEHVERARKRNLAKVADPTPKS